MAASLEHKRLVAFVNHFVVTNVKFLNEFLQTCESKLIAFEEQLSRLEAAVIILESKLASISNVSSTKTNPLTSPKQLDISLDNEAKHEVQNELKQEVLSEPKQEVLCEPKEEVQRESIVNVQNEHKTEENVEYIIPEEYKKFLKMVQVGVPVEAVKLKITTEKLDVSLFETYLK